MSSALAEALLRGTSAAEHGAFTVDTEKARSTFGRFRLANPLMYTAELVQAAVLSGATRIDIAVDADDFTISFKPTRGIGTTELTDLDSAILVRHQGAHPARLQLALAVSAAQALKPSRIVVRGDGATLTIVGDTSTLTAADASDMVTVTLRESLRAGHVVDFFKGILGRTDEERLLRDRCRHASCDIFVNGNTISQQPWPGSPHVDVVGTRDRGAVGFLNHPHAVSRLLLLRAGVIQEDLPWADVAQTPPPTGMFAIVDAGDLARDASFARFVRNEAFTTLVQSLTPHVEACAGLLEAGILADEKLALARAGILARVLGRRLLRQGSGATATAILADARLLSDPLGRPLTLRRIHQAAGKTGVVRTMSATDPVDSELLDDDVVVQLRNDEDRQLVEAMGWTLADFAPEFSHRREQRSRYQNFLSRLAEPTPLATFLLHQTVTVGEVTIQVGLRAEGPADLEMTVKLDGRRLARLHRPFPIPGLSMTLAGPFEPTSTYDDVVRDQRFSAALRRAVQTIPGMLNGPYPSAVASSKRLHDALLPLLALSLNGSVLWRAAKEAFKAPNDGTGDGFPLLELTGPRAHHAAAVQMIPRFPHGAYRLDSLSKDSAPLGFVPPGTPVFSTRMSDIVVAGDTMMAVLRKAMPNRPFVSLHEEAEQHVRQQRVLQRPPTTRQLDGVTVPIDEAYVYDDKTYRRVGAIGFAPATTTASTRLRLMFRGRLLQDRDVAGPLPGLVAVIDDESVVLDGDLLVTDSRRQALRVEAEVPALMQRLADSRDPARWVLARRLVTMGFPTPSSWLAWQSLVRSEGKAAHAQWRDMLEYGERLKPNDLESALKTMLGQNTVPSLKALTTRTTPSHAATGSTALLGDAVLSGVATALLEGFGIGKLTFECLDRSTVRLSELMKAATPRVQVVTSEGTAPVSFEGTLVVNADSELVLRHLGLAVTNVDNDIATVRARQAFESTTATTACLPPDLPHLLRRPIKHLGIAGECALLTGPPMTSATATVEVLHRGRRLDIIDLGNSLGISMAAIVDVEAITPNATFDGIVADKRREALVDLMASHVRELVEEVVNTPGMRLSESGRARVLEFMSRPNRRPADAKIASRLATVALYLDAGRREVTLDRFSKKKPMRILSAAPSPPTPAGFDDVVVVTSAMERHILDRITATTIADSAWRAAVDAAARRARLGRLPPSPPGASAIQRRTTIGDLSLTLAIPKGDALQRLWVGAEGLLVEEVVWSNVLPVVGIVDGASAVSADWRELRLTPKLLASIAREVTELWTDVARSIEINDDVSLRNLVSATALRLAAAPPGSIPQDTLALRSLLKRLALLPVASGGCISIDDALEIRPPELLPLLVEHGLLAKEVKAKPRPATPPSTAAGEPRPSPAEEPPPPPSDAVKLRERIVDEIRLVRRHPKHLLLDVEIERIQVTTGRGAAPVTEGNGRVTVDIAHPLCAAALQSSSALIIVVVAVVGALNALLESFSDDEERGLLLALARYAQTIKASDDLD
jgi:hypothetical protein